jgi:nanoRNase/pAp phosphatase (c-di-AMP/oligoRNAs hydrolase)
LDGEIVPAANSAIWQSEIGAALARNNETFAAVWFQTRDGRVKVSLRSDKNVGMDVEKIAKKYGGGGHKNASSFYTNSIPRVVDWNEVDSQFIM